MKIKLSLLVFSFFLAMSTYAQNTSSTEESNTKEDDNKTIVDKEGKEAGKEEKENPRESWKVKDTKNPFIDRPKNEVKPIINGAGTITLKNGVEVLMPVSGYQLLQQNFPNKSMAYYYLAPEKFKPSNDERHLTEVKKGKDYIIYTWCPCKEVKEKCPCEKQKVVKIVPKK